LGLVLSIPAAYGREGEWLNVQEHGASGSVFETTAVTTAGSPEVVVKNVGDFQVGQGVQVSLCHPHYERCVLKQPDNPYGTAPLGDAAEIRGYDGTSGNWTVFIIEIDGVNPVTCRWSDDLARTWKGTRVPITFDWQPLSEGTEIKLSKREWAPGHMITFSARNQLFSSIKSIEGNVLTLADAPSRSVQNAVVQHNDTAALQAAVSRAVKENRNVFLPVGLYRLSSGMRVQNPTSIVIEGASAVDTVLDISEGFGTCLRLSGGTDVTVRNLRMVGHTGLGEGPGWHSFRTFGGKACWPVGMKACAALHVNNTERVLVENVHASKMNCEAFYCQGNSRAGSKEPKAYTKLLTYLRCSATNCDGNGFNNNDMAENTSVLYCRIQDVAGCTWEGASRFVRFIGNYVRNSGTVAIGNIASRAEHFEQLGSGQHIVADNVFEGRTLYNGRPGGYIVRASRGAVQVIVRNNIFVNYNSCGIEIVPGTDQRALPATNCTITGNIMDMTCVEEKALVRNAIHVGVSGATVADNQIYVRGECDPNLTAIRLTEPAQDVIVHDNLVRNCGMGIQADTAQSAVGQIVDATTFMPGTGAVPLERRLSHRYRNWGLTWWRGGKLAGQSTIELFDPETCQFHLAQPGEMKPADRFEVIAPSLNWNLHDNTITGCQAPVVLNSYGSPTCLFQGNLIERGATANVPRAVTVAGEFHIRDNRIVGFDEDQSVAIEVQPDRAARQLRSTIHDNSFERCTTEVKDPAATTP
jgi:hypothetical protein